MSKNEKNNVNRYNISLAAKNFLGKERVGLVLFQPTMDEQLILKILNTAGFMTDHPQFDDLLALAKQTFTIGEVGELLKCFVSVDVTKVRVKRAFMEAEESSHGEGEGQVAYYPLADFFGSQLEGYSLPFQVMAILYPYDQV